MPAAIRHPAGYRAFRSHDPVRRRPVWADLWYPAIAGSRERPYAYGLSHGMLAEDAPPTEDSGRLPIAVLSHGAGGSARNYGWLAEYLARHGFAVLGVSHYGESPIYGHGTIDGAAFSRLWQRPPDCTFALDRLLAEAEFAARLDVGRVAVIGHASGGATALALAGAVFDPVALGAYCRSDEAAGDKGCDYARGQDPLAPAPPEATASWRDRRVRAAVALDPAAGPGYSEAALAAVGIPVLVVGAVDNDFLPFAHHAGRTAALLPNASLIRLESGEGHFVYLDGCQEDVAANGVPLCVDRPGVDREAVHESLAPKILGFLKAALAAP